MIMSFIKYLAPQLCELPQAKANLHALQQQPGMIDRLLRFGIGRGALFIERRVRSDECRSHGKFLNLLFAAKYFNDFCKAEGSGHGMTRRDIPDTKFSSSVTRSISSCSCFSFIFVLASCAQNGI